MSQRQLCMQDIVKIVLDICRKIFRIENNAALEGVFGISKEQLDETVEQIVKALPERFFLPGYQQKLEEIKAICAREFVFFQAQEKNTPDAEYEVNLKNFINIFAHDIQRKM